MVKEFLNLLSCLDLDLLLIWLCRTITVWFGVFLYFFNIISFIQHETLVRTVRKCYITSEVDANFIEILGKHPPTTVPASCDFIVELFIKKLESIFDLVAPLTTKIVLPKHAAPWRNEECKKLKRNYRVAEWKWRKNKWTINRQIYCEQLKTYNNALRNARTTYFTNIITDHKNNPKILFNTIDLLINPDFNRYQNSLSDSLCEDFADYFGGKIDFIRSSIPLYQNTVFNTLESLFLPEETLDSFGWCRDAW